MISGTFSNGHEWPQHDAISPATDEAIPTELIQGSSSQVSHTVPPQGTASTSTNICCKRTCHIVSYSYSQRKTSSSTCEARANSPGARTCAGRSKHSAKLSSICWVRNTARAPWCACTKSLAYHRLSCVQKRSSANFPSAPMCRVCIAHTTPHAACSTPLSPGA